MPEMLLPSDLPLRVLVLDRLTSSTELLLTQLRESAIVRLVENQGELVGVREAVREFRVNTIFIDPLTLGLDMASELVFSLRNSDPEVVFVLFQDQQRVETLRDEFYSGERARFAHYYRLDKRTPADSFAAELEATLRLCQEDLVWRLSAESLSVLMDEAQRTISTGGRPKPDFVKRRQRERNTVFLSHRFSAADEELAAGLIRFLRERGFTVVTGKLATGYISSAVLDRIRGSEYFLSLLTRADEKADGSFTASTWLHQELGAALAFGIPVVLMVENGVSDVGGLQGDIQRIQFSDKGFMSAAMDAADTLNAYAGRAPVASDRASGP